VVGADDQHVLLKQQAAHFGSGHKDALARLETRYQGSEDLHSAVLTTQFHILPLLFIPDNKNNHQIMPISMEEFQVLYSLVPHICFLVLIHTQILKNQRIKESSELRYI
jgi:hypothetical protein